MASNKYGANLQTIKLWLYEVMIIAFFVLLTVVVIMLVTGSLHILNQNFFNISHFDNITIIIAVILFLVSFATLIKNFKKIQSHLEKIIYSSKKNTH